MPYLIALLALGLAALAYAHWIEPDWLTVRSYRIRFDRSGRRLTVSRGRQPADVRAVYFSDLHAGPFYGDKRLDRLAARITGLQPHLILFGGDLVTEESAVDDPAFRDGLVRFFSRLADTAPVFAVYGNHDTESPVNRALSDAVFTAAGVTLLCNTAGTAATLSVYGSDDAYHSQPLPPPGDFSGLLLCHQPDPVPGLLGPAGPVLALSGHTHRGQVTLAGIPIVRVPLGRIYTYGLYVFNREQALLVSGGVGTVHLPFRFGARPELIELNIETD